MPALNPGLRGPFAAPFRRAFAPGAQSIMARAIAVLRRFGLDAHIYLPGVGMLNGLTAGNYLDSAGTTVGTVDQPVGLVLDAAGGLGVELVTNGGLDANLSSWVQSTANYWVASGGRAYHAPSAGYNDMVQVVPTKTGGVWIEFDYQCLTASNTAQWFYINGAGVSRTADTVGLEKLSAGVGRIRYFAADGIQKIGFARYTTAEFYLDNISVREVTGIAASQPTTASKPILRRGAVNLLTYSGDFGNAAWTKIGAGAITYNEVGPSGAANSAATITTTTATVRAILRATGNYVVGSANMPLTAAMYIKKTVGVLPRYPIVAIEEITANRLLCMSTVDTTNGVLTNWSAYTSFTINSGYASSIVSVGDYWLVAISGFASAVTNCSIEIYPAGAPTSTQSSGVITGAIGPDVVVGTCCMFQGTYTAAQIQALGGIPLTTTAPASTALGPQYWSFDGSNDSLALGGPLFQMADDHCVVAGAMCNAATGTAQIVASLSRDSSTGNSAARLQFDPSGTVSAAWTPTSGSAIITAPGNLTGSVKVLAAHKVGNVKRLRVGGVTAGTDSVVQTDTGMNSAAISDCRVGLQLPFNGAVYPIIGIKGTVPDADLLLLEKFVANLSGVTL